MFIKLNENIYKMKDNIIGFNIIENKYKILDVKKIEEEIKFLKAKRKHISLKKFNFMERKKISHIVTKIDTLEDLLRYKKEYKDKHVTDNYHDYNLCGTKRERSKYCCEIVFVYNIYFLCTNDNDIYLSREFTTKEDLLSFIELNFGKLEEFKEK